jgi:hypothetical protein
MAIKIFSGITSVLIMSALMYTVIILLFSNNAG